MDLQAKGTLKLKPECLTLVSGSREINLDWPTNFFSARPTFRVLEGVIQATGREKTLDLPSTGSCRVQNQATDMLLVQK